MNKQYTKKQIVEAIAHWQSVLESFDISENGHIMTIGELKQQLSSFDDNTHLIFTEGDGIPVYEIKNIWSGEEFKNQKTFPEDKIDDDACYVRIAKQSDDE